MVSDASRDVRNLMVRTGKQMLAVTYTFQFRFKLRRSLVVSLGLTLILCMYVIVSGYVISGNTKYVTIEYFASVCTSTL